MSRLMSVAMTTDAVLERRKTVTRRTNWWEDKNGRRLLQAGDRLTLCRKVQGRKPGEPIERLAEVEVVDVRREPLCAVAGPYVPGRNGAVTWPEVVAEGFPDMDPTEFMRRFFIDAQGIGAMDEVTRIEWRYLDHWIRDGRFVCTAPREAHCHTYPVCECEYWDPKLHGDVPAPGHESVHNDECWIKPWIDSSTLDDSYYGPNGEDAHGMEFPDGPVEHEWNGDDVLWHYADGTTPYWAEDDE